MKLSISLCIIGLALSATQLQAGGSSGGGGDTVLSAHAWFTGKRPVWYCIEVSPDFGIDEAQAEKELLSAVGAWRDLVQNGISGSRIDVSFNYKKAPTCGGWEDFTLYLGVDSKRVSAAKKKLVAPLALADRMEFQQTQAWGKGFVWVEKGKVAVGDGVAPDWTEPFALQAILRHEIGHVLGCDHLEGTVMREDQAQLMTSTGGSGGGAVTTGILTYEELAKLELTTQILQRTEHNFDGEMDHFSSSNVNMFESLTGRKPVGKIKSSLELKGGSSWQGTLTLRDEKYSYGFNLNLSGSRAFALGRAFRVVDTTGVSTQKAVQGFSGAGDLKGKDGKKYVFMMSVFGSDALVTFDVVVTGRLVNLLTATNMK